GVALHDDVEQDDGYVGMGTHELAPLGGRIGREDFEPLPVEAVVAEREARAVVHGRLVVDHRDLPARTLLPRLIARTLDQLDDVVVSHAPCPSLLRAASAAIRPAL